MQIALASTNRAKLAAAQSVATRVFGDAEIQPVAVAIDMPAQPIGDEETQAGAIARARAAVASARVDLDIGLEGGLRRTLGGWALCSWAAVVDTAGVVGVGGGGILLLPPAVVGRVLAGEELGPVIDELAQVAETRQGLGASGILTKGWLNRQRIFEDALICALAPWLHPAFSNPVISPVIPAQPAKAALDSDGMLTRIMDVAPLVWGVRHYPPADIRRGVVHRLPTLPRLDRICRHLHHRKQASSDGCAALHDLIQEIEDDIGRHAKGEVPHQATKVRLPGIGRRS